MGRGTTDTWCDSHVVACRVQVQDIEERESRGKWDAQMLVAMSIATLPHTPVPLALAGRMYNLRRTHFLTKWVEAAHHPRVVIYITIMLLLGPRSLGAAAICPWPLALGNPWPLALEPAMSAGQWHPAVRCGYIARAVDTRRRARRMAGNARRIANSQEPV
jgi:hypothetical protein